MVLKNPRAERREMGLNRHYSLNMLHHPERLSKRTVAYYPDNFGRENCIWVYHALYKNTLGPMTRRPNFLAYIGQLRHPRRRLDACESLGKALLSKSLRFEVGRNLLGDNSSIYQNSKAPSLKKAPVLL